MKKELKRYAAILLVLAMVFSLAACGGDPGEPRNGGEEASGDPVAITIASSNSGGAWYTIAGALADVYQKNIDECTSSATGGAGISNIFSVAANEAQVGFAFPDDVIDAQNGIGDFEGNAITNVKGLTALYPGVLHIAVAADSDIDSIDDLKGKTVCTQARGNAAYKMAWKVLDSYGLTENDMTMNYVGFTDAVDLIKDGHADALFYMSTFPYSALQDLAESVGVKLIGIEEEYMSSIIETSPSYSGITIPGGTYEGTDEDVTALGCTTILITNEEMSEDVVYKMVKSMFENYEELQIVNKSLAYMTPEFVIENIGIDLHQGTVKYLEEIGAM